MMATRAGLPQTSTGKPYVVVVSRQMPPLPGPDELYDEVVGLSDGDEKAPASQDR